MTDKLTLEFTREEAFQLLLMITTLNTIEAIYAPGLCQKPDVVVEKLRSLQMFVEENS
jgi:hypothetical protein